MLQYACVCNVHICVCTNVSVCICACMFSVTKLNFEPKRQSTREFQMFSH